MGEASREAALPTPGSRVPPPGWQASPSVASVWCLPARHCAHCVSSVCELEVLVSALHTRPHMPCSDALVLGLGLLVQIH